MNRQIKHINVLLFRQGLLAIVAGLLVVLCILSCTQNNPFGKQVAEADEVSDAKITLESAQSQLANVQAEYNQAVENAASAQKRIDEASAKTTEAQNAMLKEKESLKKIVKDEYVHGSVLPILDMIFSSTSFDSFVKNLDYANRIMKKKVDTINRHAKEKEEFENNLAEVLEANDSYKSAVETANAKLGEAQTIVNTASQHLTEAEAAKLREQTAAASAAQSSTPTPQSTPTPTPTPEPSPTPDPGGTWKSGAASAYDATTCAMGVAIPMSWPNYRSYYGKKVVIRYNGRVCYATICDCGDMMGGARALDLQPPVYNALGFSSASSWGVRTVEYQIIG